uniref:Uncharacterized protein n=1 Tax=Rangifer tarandus platyrhynchus TaxID=3082113 RepID=A0ACB0F663_RANTA|nr:unnamed protein product [Rangifer tarandus platyrhynchus]
MGFLSGPLRPSQEPAPPIAIRPALLLQGPPTPGRVEGAYWKKHLSRKRRRSVSPRSGIDPQKRNAAPPPAQPFLIGCLSWAGRKNLGFHWLFGIEA